MIKAGADVNVVNNNGDSALSLSANKGNLNKIALKRSRRIYLWLFSDLGLEKAVELLIESGADINVDGKSGGLILLKASASGNITLSNGKNSNLL